MPRNSPFRTSLRARATGALRARDLTVIGLSEWKNEYCQVQVALGRGDCVLGPYQCSGSGRAAAGLAACRAASEFRRGSAPGTRRPPQAGGAQEIERGTGFSSVANIVIFVKVTTIYSKNIYCFLLYKQQFFL